MSGKLHVLLLGPVGSLGVRQEQQKNQNWFWWLVILLIIILVIWWLLRWLTRRQEATSSAESKYAPVSPVRMPMPPVAEVDTGAAAELSAPAMDVDLLETMDLPAEPMMPEVEVMAAADMVEVEMPSMAETDMGEAMLLSEPDQAAQMAVDLPSQSVLAAPVRDDLTLLEGIGPKIASVLNAAGIVTFRQLATADVARLREILLAAGLRLADPTTWGEQAQLIADGDEQGFADLTNQLKGGRRV